MRGLLDQHSVNRQNNTDTLFTPYVTPSASRNSTRKRKMDDVSCETVSRLLGSASIIESCTNSSPPYSSSPTLTSTANEEDEATTRDTETCLPGKTEDNSNVILPWKQLLHFMSDNLCCRKCHKSISVSNFEKIQVSFATSVNYFCHGAVPLVVYLPRHEIPFSSTF
jgi:hypothetical protein